MSVRSEFIRLWNEFTAQSKKISELPAGSAPSGAELIEAVQGGVNVKLTVSQIGGGGGSQDLQSVLTTGSILTSDASIVPNADLIGQAVGFGTGILRFKAFDIWAGTGHFQMTENGLPTDEVFIAHPVQARFLGGQSILTIGTAGNIFEDSDFNKGLEEAADYSANKTDLSYVIKKMLYVNTFNRQTASYALVLADAGKIVEMNVGSANNLTVPLNSSVAFHIGTEILINQYGAGQTTIVATGGVTLRSKAGALKISAQYSGCVLIKVGADEWYVQGDLTT